MLPFVPLTRITKQHTRETSARSRCGFTTLLSYNCFTSSFAWPQTFILSWEIRSEFRGIPQLFQFQTFWTPEFSSEFYFSDRKMCSRQFVTYSRRFRILSHHQLFRFHELENVPAFFLAHHYHIYSFWVVVEMAATILSRFRDGGNLFWVDVEMAATVLSRCRDGGNSFWVDVMMAAWCNFGGKRYCDCFLVRNEVYWVPTYFFFGIPNFGIGILICWFFNSGI